VSGNKCGVPFWESRDRLSFFENVWQMQGLQARMLDVWQKKGLGRSVPVSMTLFAARFAERDHAQERAYLAE
jgi:hypothetical protein